MASSYLEVGSQGLTDLKNDLLNLSKALHEIYDLMNADMRQVGEAWRDGKYEEFVSGYKPQINKCEEISQRYEQWCRKVLEPAIEECIAIETTDVGGDGSAGSASSSGGSTSGGAAPSNSAADDDFSWFNFGGCASESKADKFARGSDNVERLGNKPPVMPSGDSGFDTPQNERPHLSPQEWDAFLNGRS